MKVAITGHRPNKLGNDYDLKSEKVLQIKKQIVFLLSEIVRTKMVLLECITGMALGIDTLFALICIEYDIPFTAAIPCKNQDKMWITKSKELYKDILSKANKIHYVTEGEYNSTCMQKRNEWMVDECDVLIAVWDGSNGGTKNCIDYAIKQGKKIIYIKI